ncbi:hypothetical protein HMPREF9134_00588 [Porphyromonas catoniae F0037]|uniref:Uncharacterized protein n=1 Tax=Porphyromonas catoniae F0037 TaxID=1127696 RepID=L1NFC2_9PORP|nr:hypothetical protein HMPREF9134_00588 [Porphyromonas catoniae F0037]
MLFDLTHQVSILPKRGSRLLYSKGYFSTLWEVPSLPREGFPRNLIRGIPITSDRFSS